MIFPFLDSQVEINNNELPLLKEIAWDFTKDVPLIDSGTFKTVTGKEALKVWAYKAIKTDRFIHEIYSWDYGCEITNLMGKGFSKELIISEVKRYIEEALMINEYIYEIKSIEVKFIDDTLNVDISINTYYGEVSVNV